MGFLKEFAKAAGEKGIGEKTAEAYIKDTQRKEDKTHELEKVKMQQAGATERTDKYIASDEKIAKQKTEQLKQKQKIDDAKTMGKILFDIFYDPESGGTPGTGNKYQLKAVVNVLGGFFNDKQLSEFASQFNINDGTPEDMARMEQMIFDKVSDFSLENPESGARLMGALQGVAGVKTKSLERARQRQQQLESRALAMLKSGNYDYKDVQAFIDSNGKTLPKRTVEPKMGERGKASLKNLVEERKQLVSLINNGRKNQVGGYDPLPEEEKKSIMEKIQAIDKQIETGQAPEPPIATPSTTTSTAPAIDWRQYQ